MRNNPPVSSYFREVFILKATVPIWQTNLFGFRKFEHVLIGVKYTHMNVREGVVFYRSALLIYDQVPIAVSI